jgi:hypothetical protein
VVTAQTPGQAIHDSLRESALTTFGPATPEFITWAEVPQWQRDRLEDAGKAATTTALIAEGLGDIVRERDDYRDRLKAATRSAC